MAIPITLLYGGLNALLVTALGANNTRYRVSLRLGATDPIPPAIGRKLRAHGNAAEWVPLGIVLLLILELGGASTLTLQVLGGLFFLGRLLHATNLLLPKSTPMGTMGAALNYLAMFAMSGWAVAMHFGAQ